MFSVCADPPQLQESDLHHLCASLNAPVVNIDALPVGPVRAAIVLYAERDVGGSPLPQLIIGLRSLETGRVAVYRYSGEVRKLSSASRALDVALSFAESMGFLFDDDLVGGKAGSGRARALSLWQKLVGHRGTSADSSAAGDEVVASGDIDPNTGVLLPKGTPNAPAQAASNRPATKKTGTPAGHSADPHGIPTAKAATAPTGRSEAEASLERRRRHPASRTRASDLETQGAGETPPDAGASGSRLGRVPLVRVRVKVEEAEDENASRWLHLLASF